MFTPRYLKEGKAVLKNAYKIYYHKRDLLKTDDHDQFLGEIKELEKAIKERSREGVQKKIDSIEKLAGKVAPEYTSTVRENCEVLLVAIVIAIGIRAYFLQPFKIPTGSMQPTLNGVIGTPTDVPNPNPLVQAFEIAAFGRFYVDVVSEADDRVVGLQEYARFKVLTWTQVTMQSGRTYHVHAPKRTLEEYFRCRAPGPSGAGSVYLKGQPIAHGHVDIGDHVFVDKFTYNFVKPKRGDVFVFKTTDIKGIEATLPPGTPSQFYIKRLAAVPSDVLRIEPPNLFINGELAKEFVFKRVMARENNYNGYHWGGLFLRNAKETVTIPEHYYYALGDNSANSSDSRYWGPVPEENVVGRGLFVYWPFTRHWGLIR